MELLLIIGVIAFMTLSANYISDRRMRSRYDPLPKPTTSISRTYRGALSEAVHEHEQRQKHTRDV